jgi:hypothetical protein
VGAGAFRLDPVQPIVPTEGIWPLLPFIPAQNPRLRLCRGGNPGISWAAAAPLKERRDPPREGMLIEWREIFGYIYQPDRQKDLRGGTAMNELQGQLDAAEGRNRLNNRVAVSVAIISVFMGITKIKDDNIVQAMLQHKSDAVDTWNEYQAKKLKHHMAELGLSQLQALQLIVPGKSTGALTVQRKQFLDAIARYQTEEAAIMKRAKQHEKEYDDLNFRDDQFDLSDAALSISLAMLAVTSLTSNRRLFWLCWIFAGFGVVMGIAGLLGLGLHPDFLAKLLS